MSDPLHQALSAYAERQLPRLLTQLDRDPDSPTFGCFDRNHWHYKMRDFPSSILQQGAFALEAVRRGELAVPGGGEVDRGRVERWAVGAVQALARQVRGNGSVDEYFPYERSYPAAAFGLWAALRLASDWRRTAPELFAALEPAFTGLSRLARHLDRRVEVEAANQQAAGLAALALASRLAAAGVPIDPPRHLEARAERLFALQSEEGWFEEYGGPDAGYLTVAIDALVDYGEATGDARAARAVERAIEFLAVLVGADGALPSTLNSRNTDYVVPYGLARAAEVNPRAAWLLDKLFATADRPDHFLWATDDRYTSHYITASVVRSLPWLERRTAPEPPPARSSIWLGGCGYFIRWGEERNFTAYVAAKKGGVVRIHRRGEAPILDHGWRATVAGGRGVFTSNWWTAEHAIDGPASEQGRESISIEGRMHRASFLVPTPWKHWALRLAAFFAGARLLAPLRRRLIFRPQGDDAVPRFGRRVEIGPRGVQVFDRLEPAAADVGVSARFDRWPNPRQNVRHVASADSFHREELAPPLPREERAMGGAVESEWAWTAGE